MTPHRIVNGEQRMETLVLAGEDEQKLRYAGLRPSGVRVRSRACATDEGNVDYAEGEDYVVDREAGTIRRTATSRIPDGAGHPCFGITAFDHRDYPDYGNGRYTVYIDYDYTEDEQLSGGDTAVDRADASGVAERLRRKLTDKRRLRYLVFGDSISAGGDVSREAFAFYNRFASAVRERYPDAEVEVVNKAIGGEGSTTALDRLEADVLAWNPDLVSIGYGMNDQCTMGPEIRNGIPPGLFEQNIRRMVQRIGQETEVEIILVTPCLSNPHWKHSSGDLAIYADILLRLGRELQVGVADVHALWLRELQAGKTHASLLFNNVNHPGDYGHAVYFKAFRPFLP